MSWFNPENFGTVDYNHQYNIRVVIPQRRNCFKELYLKIKRKIINDQGSYELV